MSRDYEIELENRVAFIKRVLAESGASGIVYGNSGGKDSALVGILCKKACEDTLGLIMPCATKRNYVEDMEDALTVAKEYGIKTEVVDLTPLKKLLWRLLVNGSHYRGCAPQPCPEAADDDLVCSSCQPEPAGCRYRQ